MIFKMWYIAIFLVIILIIVIAVIYYNTRGDDSDNSNNYGSSYLPVPPPTLQYMRTLDAPRRNPDLYSASSKYKSSKRDSKENIPEDENYTL